MAILFDEPSRVFKLDTLHSSYVFAIEDSGYLVHLHYGGRIDDVAACRELYPHQTPAFHPYPAGSDPKFSRGHIPQEFSTNMAGDFRIASAVVRGADGCLTVEPRYAGHRIFSGKPELAGLPSSISTPEAPAETLEITLRDEAAGIEYILLYSVFENRDAITRSVRVVNRSGASVDIERIMSLTLDFPSRKYEVLHLAGSWARERHLCREALTPGIRSIGSKRTSSSHQHNPAFAVVEAGATETAGEAFACIPVYSGSYLCELEIDELGQLRIDAGIHPENFRWLLADGGSFQAPEALLVYSEAGVGEMSRRCHALIRNNICRGPWRDAPRPILINNWEATYFDFNAEKLLKIADSAAKLGIEMLVLDDGWFGKRDDDHTSLGDWFVNTGKVGNLGELVSKVNALGLKFGLWFEPEMISPESELYRRHPEWALTVPGRTPTLSRHQMVLDMANPEVVDYLYETIRAILSSANIEYIKWDMNRQPAEMRTPTLPPERQGEVGHRFVLGVYELHRRLLETFPNLLIEGCSGGGGRFDAGMLCFAPQIWTSDDTDAIERLKIQSGTSLFYPASAMGAHVSAVPNHQTGRNTPLATRGNVAMSGTFGYEMDLGTLDEADRKLVREQIADFHRYHHLVTHGDLYRLTGPFDNPDYTAWEFAAADGSEALVTCVVNHHYPSEPTRFLRLAGLIPAARYREHSTGAVFSGSTLMRAGWQLPRVSRDGESRQFHFELVR